MLHILKRAEIHEYARFGVRSVFAHHNYPGRILVEVASSSAVVEICNGMPHVFANRWKVVPRENSLQFLRLPNPYTPSPHTWIKLRRRNYYNDIGFIKATNGNSLEVIVVPRIVYERKGKRKRGPIPKERFNPSKAKFFSGHVELLNKKYMFKGQTFTSCGYLILQLSNSFDYFHTEIFPSLVQLKEFRACELLSNELMALFVARANAPLLNMGDRVRTIAGDFKGLVGEVLTVRGAEIDIFLLENSICATISSHFVQKEFRVGNQVIVKSGAHKNLVGWVVDNNEGNITVADDALKTVSLFILTVFLSLIQTHSDKFSYCPQMLTTTRLILHSRMLILTCQLNSRALACPLIPTNT